MKDFPNIKIELGEYPSDQHLFINGEEVLFTKLEVIADPDSVLMARIEAPISEFSGEFYLLKIDSKEKGTDEA